VTSAHCCRLSPHAHVSRCPGPRPSALHRWSTAAGSSVSVCPEQSQFLSSPKQCPLQIRQINIITGQITDLRHTNHYGSKRQNSCHILRRSIFLNNGIQSYACHLSLKSSVDVNKSIFIHSRHISQNQIPQTFDISQHRHSAIRLSFILNSS
jgi:hypothetical protein